MVDYSKRGYIGTSVGASKKEELGECEASERIGIGLHLPNQGIEASKDLIVNLYFQSTHYHFQGQGKTNWRDCQFERELCCWQHRQGLDRPNWKDSQSEEECCP